MIADPNAVGHILQVTLQTDAPSHNAGVQQLSTVHRGRTGMRIKMSTEASQHLIDFLIEELPKLAGLANTLAAQLVLTSLEFAMTGSQLISCSLPIVQEVCLNATTAASVDDGQIALVTRISQQFCAWTLPGLLEGTIDCQALVMFTKLLQIPGDEELAKRFSPIRVAVVQHITTEWFELLEDSARAQLVRLLVVGNSCDALREAREGFRGALERIQLKAKDLAPLLAFGGIQMVRGPSDAGILSLACVF